MSVNEYTDDFSPEDSAQTSGKALPWAEYHALEYGDGTGRLVNGVKLLDAGIGFSELKASNAAKANAADLGTMAFIADVPDDDQPYIRRNKAWEKFSGGGGLPVGTPCLLAHRREELPDGYWFPSGDYVEITSAVGQILNDFSDTYKSDWGIVIQNGTHIRLYDPDKFFSGIYGRFFRPVNGTDRLPGSLENDAIRDITGTITTAGVKPMTYTSYVWSSTGVFSLSNGPNASNTASYTSAAASPLITFKASKMVATAEENRPYNVGLTPAVYLGV